MEQRVYYRMDDKKTEIVSKLQPLLKQHGKLETGCWGMQNWELEKLFLFMETNGEDYYEITAECLCFQGFLQLKSLIRRLRPLGRILDNLPEFNEFLRENARYEKQLRKYKSVGTTS